MNLAILLLAIVIEVGASLALKASQGLSRFEFALPALSGFGVSLYLLSFVSQKMPLSLTYPTWAGLGIIGTSLGAAWLFGEALNLKHWVGVLVIMMGLGIMYWQTDSGGRFS